MASGATALLVELVAYRPLRRRNAPPLAFLITAIGASVAISRGVGIFTHQNIKGVPPLIRPATVVHVRQHVVTNLQILIIVLALVLMVALDRFINRTRLGRGHPGGRPGPGHRRADGRQQGPGHLAGLPASAG